MEVSFKIEYNWSCDEHDEIPTKYHEALTEDAEARIFEQVSEGYVSGELFSNIRIDDEDGEDGIEFSGWWSRTPL